MCNKPQEVKAEPPPLTTPAHGRKFDKPRYSPFFKLCVEYEKKKSSLHKAIV